MNELEIVQRITAVEERAKSNTHQIAELKPVVEEIHTMSKTMVQLVAKVQHTNESVTEIKEKVEELEKEPGRNWNTAKQTVLDTFIKVLAGAVVTGLITLALQHL